MSLHIFFDLVWTNEMNRAPAKSQWNFFALGLFGIAMGALEAIVVLYIRQIYYPRGFDFPLTMLSQQLLSVEWLRETATLIMLAVVGSVAGRNNLQRFAYFLYTFAVWDISYYAWLKILLNWPSSFLTWDVLFLIPVPWIGPVLAPVIASLTMILLGGTLVMLQEKGCIAKMTSFEWSLTFLGAFIILYTFTWDYSQIIIREYIRSGFETFGKTGHLYELIAHYKPAHYPWHFFALGEISILCALALMYKRSWKAVRNH